ncbi:MAG: hypothetical protein EXS13_13755 [Planctomycetes bacterium]|nr:hypothetical protein [Planctomycetota bacterium]
MRAALRWAGQRRAVVALLCKSAVARKALAAAWRDDIRGIDGARCALRSIDARRWFGASVDAALLVVRADGGGATQGRARSCAVYAALDVTSPTRSFGWADGELLADVERGPEDAALRSSRPTGWRSGIKHDAAALFELVGDGRRFVNGLGDRIELESELVWPLLKATDLARGRSPTRWLLVPQQSMSEDPAVRLAASPLARAYLERHADRLQRRKSRIYRGRPIGSLFGVGDYSFAPWKVAVSALHAQPRFRVVGPHAGRPVVVEDTCCILACRDEAQASARAAWLDSRPAQEFLAARTFADRKRPITVELLDRLAIHEIGAALDGGTGIRAPDPPRATGP